MNAIHPDGPPPDSRSKTIRIVVFLVVLLVAAAVLPRVLRPRREAAPGDYDLNVTIAHSPEVAEFVSNRSGERITSCFCPAIESMRDGEIEECTASTESGKSYKVRIQRANAQELKVLTFERGDDLPNWIPSGRSVALAMPFVALVSFVGAIFGLLRLIGSWRSSFVSPLLPLVPQQNVFFNAEGSYVLYRDGRRIGNDLSGVTLALWDPVAANWVDSNSALRSRVSGFDTVRTSWRIFHVPRAGEFQLVAHNLDPAKAPYRDQLIFGRPVGEKMLGYGLLMGAGFFAFVISIIAIGAMFAK